jgi:hypothetical protein
MKTITARKKENTEKILKKLKRIIAKTTLKEITYENLAKLIISNLAEPNKIILRDEILETIVNKLIDFHKDETRRYRLCSIALRNVDYILYSLDITSSKHYQNDIDYLEKINKENKLPNQKELKELMIICLNILESLNIYLQL